MSNNFNALYNAAVVATNHAVPATTAASATGANSASVQGHAAAASGAAAHGAANVAGTNVSAAAGAGNSAQHGAAATRLPVGRMNALRRTDSTTDVIVKKDNGQLFSARANGLVDKPFAQHFPPPPPFKIPRYRSPPPPGNSNVRSSSTQPIIGGVKSSGNPVSSAGRRVPKRAALRRTDSTTDCLEKQDDGQYFSARMQGTVAIPFAQHFPPPPPFDGPTVDSSASSGGPVPSTEPAFDADQPAFPPGLPFPNVLEDLDSTMERVQTLMNDEYSNVRLSDAVERSSPRNSKDVFPDNLFAPVGAAASTSPPCTGATATFANPGPPGSDADSLLTQARFRAFVDARLKYAVRDLEWEEPGLRVMRPQAHHITPDDCLDLVRLCVYRKHPDESLIQGEAMCVGNKVRQLDFLAELRKENLAKPEHLCENFVTGAELAAKFERERIIYWRLLTARQVAFIAEDFFPEGPPVPAPQHPPPPSIWTSVLGAVTNVLKRKRDADAKFEEPPAKRARVEYEKNKELRFTFLRRLPAQRRPRPRRGAIAATNPAPLPYHGAALYPTLHSMSDVATQTDEDMSPPVAGPSRQPPSRTPSLTDAGVAGPSRHPSKAPLSRSSSLTNAGASSSAGPIRTGKQRQVHFAPFPSMVARPRRCISPPPPEMVGESDDEDSNNNSDDDDDGRRRVEDGIPEAVRYAFSGALLTSETLAALGLDFGDDDAESTSHHLFSHPNDWAGYKDFSAQWPPASDAVPLAPSEADAEPLSPLPDAAPGQKRRRGTRAGKQVQRRRALKEAATATEGDVKTVRGA